MGSIIQLYATGTGGLQDGLVSVDIPQDGMILGIQYSVTGLLDAASEFLQIQLSFGSSRSNVHDSRQVIWNGALFKFMTTSGTYQNELNGYCSLPDLPVGAGERLFVHLNGSAGVTSTVWLCLHLSFDEARPSVRRR